ncbi:acyl-CoA thioesterase [Lachnospiraceae bacterium 62-35]
MEFQPYEHKTQYYETDQMGIIHHSNYIRWFEEARTDLMEQMGMGYDIMEAQGIIIPVLSVQCEYKSMTHFGETLQILPIVREYNGIRMTIEYTVIEKETGELRCVGRTRHCFLTKDGKPVSLKKKNFLVDDLFRRVSMPEE